MLKNIALILALGLGVAALTTFGAAAGDYENGYAKCWQVVAWKSAVVFANVCEPEASFKIQSKDLSDYNY